MVRRVNFERDKRIKAAKDVAAAERRLDREDFQRKQRRAKKIQSLQLGVGFPLLFGGGAGAVAGGALGALSDSGNNFGGQILFSALGQQIDTFIQNLGNLADSLDSAESILDGLADAGFRVSKELRKSVEALEDQGRFIDAYNVAIGELEERFGPNAVQELSNYDAANEALQEELSKAAGTLQKELLPALTLVTSAVAGLLGLINQSGGILKFLAGLTPAIGPSVKIASDIGGEAARRVTSSPTNAFGFQSNTGPREAADRERLAREKESAELVRQINRNQEAISRAREEAARKELKHQQDILKLTRDRQLLEARIIEDQLRLQRQQRAFQLEQAQIQDSAASNILNARRITTDSALKTIQSGGTSPRFATAGEAFKSKLEIEYEIIDRQVKDLGNSLLLAGNNTEFVREATRAYREELRAAAAEANRLEQVKFETTEEVFIRRAAFLKAESKLLTETDEKVKKLIERQITYAKALLEVRKAGLDPLSGAGKTFIDATLDKFDAANNKLSFFEQNIVDLTNTVGVQLKNAMETSLSRHHRCCDPRCRRPQRQTQNNCCFPTNHNR